MNLSIIDTHAHMCDQAFDQDRAEVLARAESAGVKAVVAVGENMSDARRNLELSAQFTMLRPAAGLYPSNLSPDAALEMAAFIRARQNELVAIGEVGLDFWVVKDDHEREIQRDIFRLFIDLSRETGLPLNVHSRSAGRHAVAMLLEQGAKKVQLHAFDGKASTALPAAEAGYFFSVPPSVVRSRQKQKLVKQLPLSRLMVESDSPVLGPVPGVRNEPANASMAIQAIAEVKGLREDEVAEALLRNTCRLLGEVSSSRS